MKENLEHSLDVALRMRKLCETASSICQEVIEGDEALNDGLEVLIAGLFNGISNIHVKLDNHLALLLERREMLGKEGFEKVIQVSLNTEEEADDDFNPHDPYAD